MRYLFVMFLTMPILEMWILIEVGARIGGLNTIALVFLTAVLGMALLRQQGLNTLLQFNQRLEQGQLPAEEILSGVMLAVGGALLLTPGFVTDAIGFACLIPSSRRLIVAGLLRQGVIVASAGIQRNQAFDFYSQQGHFRSSGGAASRPDRGAQAGEGHNTIDGDFRRED